MKKMILTSLFASIFLPCLAQAGDNWFTPTTENLPDALVANHVYKAIDIGLKNTSQTGSADLQITDMVVPNGFPNDPNAGALCDGPIPAPGQSCPIFMQETFSPNANTSNDDTWSFTVVVDGAQGFTKIITRPLNATGIYATRVQTLPSNIDQDISAPVEYLYTNNSPTTTQPITLTLPTSTTVPGLNLETNCGATLAPNATCMVWGAYQPLAGTPSQTSVAYTIDLVYGNQWHVPITDKTTVNTIHLTGEITTPLPANLSAGIAAPIVYQFRNESDGEVTGLTITLPTTLPAGVSLNTSNCSASLPANGVCTVSGTFLPTTAQTGTTVSIPVSATYAQGSAVLLNTSTLVGHEALTGQVSTALPANLAEGAVAPVVFTIQNTSSAAVTGLSIYYPNNISGLTLSNGCSSSLAGGGVCLVTGTYTAPIAKAPTDPRGATIPLTVSYDQGAPFDLTTSTTIAEIALTGSVTTALPTNLAEGQSAHFVYTISNGNQGIAAGITVSPLVVAGLTDYTTTCGSTLAISANCTISGTYTAPATTSSFAVTMPVTVSYEQGSDINLNTTTSVQTIVLNGAVSSSLPANIAEGETSPFAFTITAGNHGPATGITETLPSLAGLTFTHQCPTSLAANDSCTISGTYTAPATTDGYAVNIPISIAYDQGSTIHLTTGGTVHAIALSAVATVPLQSNIAEGTTQSFTYTITNTTTASSQGSQATNITVSNPSIPGLVVSSTCGNLSANTSCTIQGTYTAPSVEGHVTIPLTVHYDQGSDLSLTQTTYVSDIVLTQDLTGLESLPANMGVGHVASFRFVLKNTSIAGNVTNIVVTPTSIAGVAYTTTCQGNLAVSSACTIEGTFTAQASQENTSLSIPFTVSYDQGNPISLAATTTIDDIAISGSLVTGLPSTIHVGNAYPLDFRFTRNATLGTATGITVQLPANGNGLVLSNGCSSTLATSATCDVTGTYTPPTANQTVSLSVTLAYSQGANVALNTTGVVPNETTLSTTSGSELTFAPDETTTIDVTNSGSEIAYNVAAVLPQAILDHLATGSITTCGAQLASGASCSLVLTMDSTFATTGDAGDVTVAGDNTTTVTFDTVGVATLVSAPSITLVLPGNNYALTLSNTGDSALSALSLSASLPASITQGTGTCGTTLAANTSCTYIFIATPAAYGTTALTLNFTVNGVAKTLSTSLAIPNATVAITNSGGSTGEDISAILAGGNFTITNTSPYTWQSGGSALDITRDDSDSSWLTLKAGTSNDCFILAQLAPGASCQVGYEPITAKHDLAATITAHGANLVNTSQNLIPQDNVSIGIDADAASQHLGYEALIVTNLTSLNATITAQTVAAPGASIVACDPVGTGSPNCPTPYLSTCAVGTMLGTSSPSDQCRYWYKALASTSLSADATLSEGVSVTSTIGTTVTPHTRTVNFAYGNDLYVGGDFTTVDGAVSANRIAKWDGTSWSAVDASGMGNNVAALFTLNGDLYAGGFFTTAGGITANRIARWNGTSWNTVGTGANGALTSFASIGSDLYAGGSFTSIGGISASNIARWDGSSWSALGSGTTGSVNALATLGTDLYVGGAFSTTPANYIAKWDGTSWSALGSGMNNSVNTLTILGNTLYAGGAFNTAGGSSANRIASWNGSAWSALSGGVSNPVNSLASIGTNLYAAGAFTAAGGSGANRIATWSGSAWSALGTGLNATANAVTSLGSTLYAAGNFTSPGNYIAAWNGSAWSALSSGLSAQARALVIAQHINLS